MRSLKETALFMYGDITIPAGESLTFKYRFYFHKGDDKQAEVAERYCEYTKGN